MQNEQERVITRAFVALAVVAMLAIVGVSYALGVLLGGM